MFMALNIFFFFFLELFLQSSLKIQTILETVQLELEETIKYLWLR